MVQTERVMESYAELGELVRDGERNWKQYGEVNAHYWNGLVLFNYGFGAEMENRWNWFERVSRGLILDEKTGNLVALCMERFWNWGQRTTEGKLVEVTEKVDGSLGLLFRHKGEWRVATRGSFESEQAVWASEFINKNWKGALKEVSEDLTLMFEIIYPSNRIVVDYGGREDLVLIAVRDKFNLHDWFFQDIHELGQYLGFDMPRVVHFASADDIMEAQKTIDANQEGWVARFSDGTRFKFKGDDYVHMHRIINDLTFKRMVEAVRGGHLDGMLVGVPDELARQVRDWRFEIEAKVAGVKRRVEESFVMAPKDTRKDYALWVRGHCPGDAPYMFRRLDGKDYTDQIYKREFS